jgi:DNA-binding CsgD family transcriptional regulator
VHADYTDLLHKIYTSALLEGGLSGVLSDLAATYPDVPISYQAQCVYKNRFYDAALFNHEDNIESHLENARSANPFPPIALKCDMSKVAVTTDYISPSDVEKTAFYDEVLSNHRQINRAFGIILHRQGEDSAFVAANLPKAMGAREEQHVLDLFRFLRPHLQGAFSLLLETTKRGTRIPNPEFWLDQIPTAACIVAPDGKVQHLNKRADQTLKNGGLLHIDRMVNLTARNGMIRRALEAALSRASSASVPVGPVSLTQQRQGGPFFFVMPVQHKEQVHPGLAPFIAPTQPLLITIFDPDESPKNSEYILAAAFGLTERESLLVQQLILGSSLREAAEILEVSYNTARNQLASATSKTGSHSQSDIVRRGTQVLAKLGEMENSSIS